MEKFVVRTKNTSQGERASTSTQKRLSQTTIESLKGVVVIEDILRMKTILKVEGQTKDNLMTALKELSKKIPSRDVLKSTKIGHTVNRLTKHTESEVVALSTTIVKTWKKHFEDKLDKPMIEVKCDQKTEQMRRMGRKHLSAALGVSENNSLPKLIEQETFHRHGRLLSVLYRRTLRKLVFMLKHQTHIKEQVMNRTLEITDLVSRCKQEAKFS